MSRECGRCGALLDESEGICPTCGEVYGNQTLFQMPQITPEMLAADAERYKKAAPAPVQPRAPQPASAPPPTATRSPTHDPGPAAAQRPMPAQRGPLAPSNKQFAVLLVMVLTGAMLIGVVVGLVLL